MCTSIFPDPCTTAGPMPSSKMRAHRERRSGETAFALATRETCSSAYAGLICGSRPDPEPVTASVGTADGDTPSRAPMSMRRCAMKSASVVLLGPRLLGNPAAGSPGAIALLSLTEPTTRVWKNGSG